MSDLAATNCGCGCDNNGGSCGCNCGCGCGGFGNNNCLFLILILLCCGVDGGLWWLAALMVLLAGMILTGMGVTGEYIARIYDETRNRPLYIVGETWGFDENAQ